MSKTLEKILEDELFKTEKFEGLGSLSIKNTSKDTKMQIDIEGNSFQETRDGKNIAKINETNWELTENNTIKNKAGNEGARLTKIDVKEGQTVNVYLKLLSKPSKSTTFSAYVDDVVNTTIQFNNFQTFELNEIHKKTFVAEKDCNLKYTMWGNADSETFEFQFWVSIDEELEEYELYGVMPSTEFPSKRKSCGDEGNINFTISNQNVAKIDEQSWKLTENNTIGNIISRGNGQYLTTFYLKKGQTVHIYIKLIARLDNMSLTFYSNGTVNNSCSFSNLHNTNIWNLNQVYTRTYTAKEDCIITYRCWSSADIGNAEFQFWAEIDTSDLADNYILHEEQDISISVQKPFRAVKNNRDTFNLKDGKWYEQHKIKRIEGYNNEEINTDYMSTTGGLDVGATVDYVSDEPELIECTEEQTKALDKLQRILSYEELTNIICMDEIACNYKVTAKVSKIKELMSK